MAVTLGIVEFNADAYGKQNGKSLCALASRRFAGGSVLEWVARRVSESELLDKVVVVAREGPISELARQCTPQNITLFVSPEADSLARSVSAIEKFDAKAIVRVCVDNPFIDPVLIDRLIAASKQSPNRDFIGFCSADEKPLTCGHGMLADWCSASSVRRANTLAPADLRGDLSAFIRSQPDMFGLKWIPAPAQLVEDDMRLRIDVEEDWDHAQVIYEALDSASLDWQGITKLLDQQPAIRRRMADLNRASA
jgi:spore coat polysaccharide biosynthesis protein SpsF